MGNWRHWDDRQGVVEAQRKPVPLGLCHLHMLYIGGKWRWRLRIRRLSGVCNTVRCVRVELNSVGRCP